MPLKLQHISPKRDKQIADTSNNKQSISEAILNASILI